MKRTMIISYKVAESTTEVDLLEKPLYWNLANGGALRIIPNYDKEKELITYSITCVEYLSISHQIILVADVLQGKKIIFENDDYTFLLLRNDIGNYDGAISKTYFDNKLEQIYNKLRRWK